jgi:hypothetical protein
VFAWADTYGDRIFAASELGDLLRRFGDAYSSVSPTLRSPYADEFEIYGAVYFNSRISARIQFFRWDGKRRIVAMDIGVPPTAYRPVKVLDPGPDGILGTFDDRVLTV